MRLTTSCTAREPRLERQAPVDAAGNPAMDEDSHATASGKDETTARDAMQKAEKMLKPLSLNFRDVASFVKYLITCMGAEVYSEADKWLVSLSYD
eukprot:2136853-Rhodomonas_salina.2